MQQNSNLNSAWPDTSFACCRTCKACKPHTRRPTGGPLEFLCATSQVGTPVENWGKFSRMCVRYSAGLLGRNCPLDWTVENFETHHSAIQAIKAMLFGLFDVEIRRILHWLVNLGEGACQMRTSNCFVSSTRSSLHYDAPQEVLKFFNFYSSQWLSLPTS